ncbi:MAG: hypothetical protein JRC67_00660 [Deltaproteobacteria bacterium]|nr:hypothetical protein [Deltaproteobacteria bacterium]
MAAGSSPPVDPKMVALEVQKGKSLEEVQRIFGIELKSQVQDLYVRGLRQLGEIPRKARYRTCMCEASDSLVKFHSSRCQRQRIGQRPKLLIWAIGEVLAKVAASP